MTAAFDVEVVGMTPVRIPADRPFTVSPVGLIIEGEMSFEDWREIARNFGNSLRSAAFCIGDWLIYGESKFGRQLPLDAPGFDSPRPKLCRESYDEAVALTGLDMSTLQTYASVCRSIPITERDPRLSFEHHKALAPIPAQKRPEWLALVSQQTAPISVRKLRASIRLAGEKPRLFSSDELMARPTTGGLENYVPHLARLVTILRKTLPGMDEDQRKALKQDAQPLLAMLDAL